MMFALIGWGLDIVIILMLFGIMSKLEEISRLLARRDTPKAPEQLSPPQ